MRSFRTGISLVALFVATPLLIAQSKPAAHPAAAAHASAARSPFAGCPALPAVKVPAGFPTNGLNPYHGCPTAYRGLVYVDNPIGDDGAPTENGARIVVRYTMRLPNGTVIDDHQGDPLNLVKGSGLMRFFDNSLDNMTAGGSRRVYVPAAIATAERPIPNLPAGSDLILDITLVAASHPERSDTAPTYAELLKNAPTSVDQGIVGLTAQVATKPELAQLLGDIYSDLPPPAQNFSKALAYYRSVESTSANARLRIALMHLYGDGVPQNPAEARRRLKALAENEKDPTAAWILKALDLPQNKTDLEAELHYKPLPYISKTNQELDTLFGDGNVLAGYTLAKRSRLDTSLGDTAVRSQNAESAFSLVYVYWRVAASQGNPVAAYHLGELAMHANSNNYMATDINTAIRFFYKSADKGYAPAISTLAENALEGVGEAVNVPRGVAMLEKAAATDDPQSKIMLGNAFRDGAPGFQKSNPDALQWYRKAAATGSSLGLLYLGMAYEYGLVSTPDYTLAMQNYRAAASAGDPAGYHFIAQMYLVGRGVAQNTTTARHFFQLAADHGYFAAAAQLAELDLKKKQAAQAAQLAEQQRQAQSAQAEAQAEYQRKLDAYNARVADLRQRADEAESEAEQAEEVAQSAKSEADTATNTGGVAGLIGALGGTAAQTKYELDAQKKRRVADNLRAQLRDMGEEAPDPPAIQNSFDQPAAPPQPDPIEQAKNQALANINATAANNRAQQNTSAFHFNQPTQNTAPATTPTRSTYTPAQTTTTPTETNTTSATSTGTEVEKSTYVPAVPLSCISYHFDTFETMQNDNYDNHCNQDIDLAAVFPDHYSGNTTIPANATNFTFFAFSRAEYNQHGGNPELYACPYRSDPVDANDHLIIHGGPVKQYRCRVWDDTSRAR